MGFERLLHIPPKKTEVKSIKCFEVHTVKQTKKQYSFIVRRFLVETANQFVKELSPKSLRNREGFWYNRRKTPREAPSWKSTPKAPAAKQWLLT